jgi:CheY-like chemotaxis protein
MNALKTNNAGSAASATLSVFVVDDEPMLLELVAVILEPLGYVIRTFHNPTAALEALKSAAAHPALLITDYAMPSMNGMDLIAASRRIEPRQKTLLVSGTVGSEVYHHAADKPDGFLAKPFQAKQLVDAVKTLLC